VAVGPVRNEQGKMDARMTSERVDGEGVSNIAEAAATRLPRASLFADPVMQASDFNDWEQKNDTVMGGSSSSEVSASEGGSGVRVATTRQQACCEQSCAVTAAAALHSVNC
jgi:Complex I intermediate-associated protein 30 (CIA30)